MAIAAALAGVAAVTDRPPQPEEAAPSLELATPPNRAERSALAQAPTSAAVRSPSPGLFGLSGLSRTDGENDAAPAAPAPHGALIFGLWGDRYFYPATVVGRDGEAYQVVFEDGDRATLDRHAFFVGRLAPGSHVEFSRTRGGFVRGVVVPSTQAILYRIRGDDGDAWVQPRNMRIPAGAVFRTDPPPDAPSSEGDGDGDGHEDRRDPNDQPREARELSIARYRGRAHWYTCAGILATSAGARAPVDVLYDDGTRETLAQEHTRTGTLTPGHPVRVRAGDDWLAGSIAEVAGRAVAVRVAEEMRWYPLGEIRFDPDAPPF